MKAQQRPEIQSRQKPFDDWHRRLGVECVFLDIDKVEWRKENGIWLPAAVFEITRIDGEIHKAGAGYKKAILDRMTGRDSIQAYCAKYIATALKVDAWIVLFQVDCTMFSVYNLSQARGWWDMDEGLMMCWIKKKLRGVA